MSKKASGDLNGLVREPKRASGDLKALVVKVLKGPMGT